MEGKISCLRGRLFILIIGELLLDLCLKIGNWNLNELKQSSPSGLQRRLAIVYLLSSLKSSDRVYR